MVLILGQILTKNYVYQSVYCVHGYSCAYVSYLERDAMELATILAALFTRSISSGTLPSYWLEANIAPVFQKGDCHCAEN